MKLVSLFLIFFFFVNVTSIIDRTYFNYLGLKITANSDDIKKAFELKRQKIQNLENEDEKNRKMKLLKEAFQTLHNQQSRKRYERYGKDIFKTIKEPTWMNKMNPQNPVDTRKGPAFKLTIPVSIDDIYNGTVVKAKYPKKSACTVCQGTGAKSPKDLKPCSACAGKGFSLFQQRNHYGHNLKLQNKCPVCQGSGKTVLKQCGQCHGSKLITKMETIQISVPKGLPNGNKITMRNQGEEEVFGAPSDFQVTIVEVPSNQWSKESFNLVYKMEISLEQSIFGFVKEIQHLSGQQILIERNQFTTKQTKHIVKGKGLVNKQGYMGNLIVKFKIIIPKFTDEQLTMWEDFFNEHPM